MKKQIPDGVWPVMMTPLKSRDEMDWNGLEKLTEWYISAGGHGLFSACFSSEALEIGRRALIQRVVDIAEGLVSVVAGVMGVVERSKRIDMIRSVLEFGSAAAVLTLCDILGKRPDDRGWMDELIGNACRASEEVC